MIYKNYVRRGETFIEQATLQHVVTMNILQLSCLFMSKDRETNAHLVSAHQIPLLTSSNSKLMRLKICLK